MRLSNGDIVYTNPYAADSDNDGLLDGEEIIKGKVYHFPASQFDRKRHKARRRRDK